MKHLAKYHTIGKKSTVVYIYIHLKGISDSFSSCDLYQSIIKKSPVDVFNIYSYEIEIFSNSCGEEIKATYTYPE